MAGSDSGRQVGVHIGTAEGVDRLLRVADHDHLDRCRTAGQEGGGEHLPLERVGVLELVDHHDLVALAQCQRMARLGRHGITGPADHVVVGEDAELRPALQHTVAHGEQQLPPRLLQIVGHGLDVAGAAGGPDLGRDVGEHQLDDLAKLRFVGDRVAGGWCEQLDQGARARSRRHFAEHGIVGDLAAQITVVGADRLGGDVVEEAERRQRLVAETVDRRDRREVERGHRLPRPLGLLVVAGRCVGQTAPDAVP